MKNILLLRTLLFKLIFYSIIIFNTNLYSFNNSNNNKSLFWVDAGIGYSSVEFNGAYDVALNLQNRKMIFSLRYIGVGGSDSFIFAKRQINITDIAALIGIANIDTNFHVSFAGGFHYGTGELVDHTDLFLNKKVITDISPKLGLALNGKLFWKVGKVFGFGINLFISLSKKSSFYAITFNTSIGSLY